MVTLASLSYIVASVLFILALRGLSHPETARQGLNFGMFGMALAIITTLLITLDTFLEQFCELEHRE